MASASVNTQASSKETSNYPRLCRLLVEVGTQVLRETFDKIHPSASLHVKLSSHSVLARLELLYKGKDKILNPTQWEQLYPSNPSSVSSLNFDAILLMVLLRNISGLHPPTSGWGKPPPAKDTSIGAAITRLWVFRNEINDHASKSQIDDLTFEEYWKDIQQTLTRLGGERYGPYIDKLKTDYMDPDIALQYQERLKKWREDEVIIDEIEGNVSCLYAQTLDISTLEPLVDFKTASKQWGVRAVMKKMMRSLLSWGKPKAGACSRVADQNSADAAIKQLHELCTKIDHSIQPVFETRKICEDLKMREPKPSLINQQCVVYNYKCDLCDGAYVGFTSRHLHQGISQHRFSAIRKHLRNDHKVNIIGDLTSNFSCNGK